MTTPKPLLRIPSALNDERLDCFAMLSMMANVPTVSLSRSSSVTRINGLNQNVRAHRMRDEALSMRVLMELIDLRSAWLLGAGKLNCRAQPDLGHCHLAFGVERHGAHRCIEIAINAKAAFGCD
jgi:hypothetical protein